MGNKQAKSNTHDKSDMNEPSNAKSDKDKSNTIIFTFDDGAVLISELISKMHSIIFPSGIAVIIIDLAMGQLSLNTEQAYSARVLDTIPEDVNSDHHHYSGYKCSFEGRHIMKPYYNHYNFKSLNTTPYPVDRLLLDQSLRDRIWNNGDGIQMVLSFRFKVVEISTGDHYGSLFSCTDSLTVNGNVLHSMNLIDSKWHTAICRVN